MDYPFVEAKVIADSAHPTFNRRLTTIQVVCPRFIWAEMLTHRMFSRNAQSSRACPVKKMIEEVRNNPVVPIEWGANQPGMQANKLLTTPQLEGAQGAWRRAATAAANEAQYLMQMGAHKQIVNRILEPYVTISSIITGTEWDNFFKLRIHEAAQPEIRATAQAMKAAMDESEPEPIELDGWHLPYVSSVLVNDIGARSAAMVSAARCARVSYKNHDGTDCDVEKDLALAKRLMDDEHWSPFEHQAYPLPRMGMSANFDSFEQHRSWIRQDAIDRGWGEFKVTAPDIENCGKTIPSVGPGGEFDPLGGDGLIV